MQMRGSGGTAEHSDLQICISLDFFYFQRSIYRIRASLFKFIVCFYVWIILYYRMIYNTTSHINIHHLSLSLLISLFINPTRSLSFTLSLNFFSFQDVMHQMMRAISENSFVRRIVTHLKHLQYDRLRMKSINVFSVSSLEVHLSSLCERRNEIDQRLVERGY